MKPTFKALILVAMGLFLYTRFFGGTLLFYINERFIWLTLLAAVGFIAVGFSYRYRLLRPAAHEGHEHGNLSWAGALLVLSPVILGLLVPPKPLGADAMSNREISVDSFSSVTGPTKSTIMERPQGERNILDWLVDFWATQDPNVFDGQEAEVVGFVYRDDRFDENTFMVSRFVISCCAADASPLGLIVRSPDSSAFPDDQWVEVRGTFEAGLFDGREMPLLNADMIVPTDIPSQPYLYPY